MLKTNLFFIINLLLIGSMNAQNLRFTPVVKPTEGGHGRVGNFSLGWTVGEPAQTTIKNGNLVFTQGFQQPEKPLPPVAPAPLSVCSDTAYTFTFAHVLAGAGGDQVEWSLRQNFDTSCIITSGDTIRITVNSGIRDTIWLRSRMSQTRCVSTATYTTVYPVPTPIPVFVAGDTVLFAGDTMQFTATASYNSSISYSILSGGALIDSLTGWVKFVTSDFTVRAIAYTTNGCNAGFSDIAVKVYKDSLPVFKMPLTFQKNLGQWNDSIKYQTGVDGTRVYFLKDKLVYINTKYFDLGMDTTIKRVTEIPQDSTTTLIWYLKFLDSNPNVVISDSDLQEGYYNYLYGSDTTRYITNVPVFSKISYDSIYPNIGLQYHTTKNRKLEYDFILHPSSDIDDIRLQFSGIEIIGVDSSGNLLLNTPFGQIKELAPISYQTINDTNYVVDVRYQILNDSTFGFLTKDNYNPDFDLVIDPISLQWDSWFADNSTTVTPRDIFVKPAGTTGEGIYITGKTTSGVAPVSTAIPPPGTYNGSFLGGNVDAFVLKTKLDGSGFYYFSFVGGSKNDMGQGITVTSNGSPCVAGVTNSKDNSMTGFPSTILSGVGPGPSDNGVDNDAFLIKLGTNGASVTCSHLFGGTCFDGVAGIAVTGDDRIIAVGATSCFPSTASVTDFPGQNATNGGGAGLGDGIIDEILSNNTLSFTYPLLVGGSGDDEILDVQVYSNSKFYMSGSSGSDVFTANSNVTPGHSYPSSSYSSIALARDAMIITDDGSGNISYLARMGTDAFDIGVNLAIDNSGDIYMLTTSDVGASTDLLPFATGITPVRDFKYTGFQDAHISKFNNDCSQLLYGSYIGPESTGFIFASGLGIGPSGSIYILRDYFNTTEPMSLSCAFDPQYSDGVSLGASDLYFATVEIDNPTSYIRNETFLGGTNTDGENSSFINIENHIYFGYQSQSSAIYTNPTNATPYQATRPFFSTTTSNVDNVVVAEFIDESLDAGPDQCYVIGSFSPPILGGDPTYDGTTIANPTYEWIPGTSDGLSCADCANPIATPDETTTYTVSLINDGHCIGSDEVVVNVIPAITIDVTPAVGIPCTGTPVLTATTVTGANYTWNNGTTTIADDPDVYAVTVTSVGDYFLTVTDASNCSSTATVTVHGSEYCCEGDLSPDNFTFTNISVTDFIAAMSTYVSTVTFNSITYQDFAAFPYKISFNGTFEIDQNFIIANCQDVTFGAGARIVVDNGVNLRISRSHLYACDEYLWKECTSGREYDCSSRKVWGFQTGPLWGGFAQYTQMPAANVVKLQDNVSFNDAAAISMVGMTAWHMLVTRAKIVPGQTVLIMGGGSGMGIAGIQIANLYNCRVIATAGNKDKMEKCLQLGADYVVNHREPDWYRKVREITNKEGVDIVYEHIGKTVFPQELSLLKMGGTLVSTGATTGYDSTIDLRYLFFKGINLLGATQGTKAGLEEVIRWVSKGKIKPVIDTVLPFSNMVDGHLKMSESQLFGKILTTPQKL